MLYINQASLQYQYLIQTIHVYSYSFHVILQYNRALQDIQSVYLQLHVFEVVLFLKHHSTPTQYIGSPVVATKSLYVSASLRSYTVGGGLCLTIAKQNVPEFAGNILLFREEILFPHKERENSQEAFEKTSVGFSYIFHAQLECLRKILYQNGYPTCVFDRCVLNLCLPYYWYTLVTDQNTN